MYQGCNIENSSFGPTVCAERTAIFKAVYDGCRDFTDIAICGGREGVIREACPPCGVCRQVMSEFCGPDFRIHVVEPGGFRTYTLSQLLPCSFEPGDQVG